MKSRITIDLDWDNQPIIKIEYSPSEDVRDKMVKKFLETFGGSSMWAQFSYTWGPDESSSRVAIVRPIPQNIGDLKDQLKLLQKTIDNHSCESTSSSVEL